MKILILSIFSEGKRNNEFLKIQRENLIKNEFIDYYFITYDENLTEEFLLVDDMLFIKGKENIMNVLDKTIKAFRYFTNIERYDFIVRTNISTVLNFKLLCNYLNSIPKNNIYAGSIYFKLSWLDEISGITKETTQKYNLNELNFFQGTCIILSFDVVKFMLGNQEKIIHEIIDDVSIALFIKTYMTPLYDSCLLNIPSPKYIVLPRDILPRDKYIFDIVVFRIKSFNDEKDIQIMNEIFSYMKAIKQKENESI